jgi:hypothetical protein
MFPVRYELNLYILFRRNSVFKGLIMLFQLSIGYNMNQNEGFGKRWSRLPEGTTPEFSVGPEIPRLTDITLVCSPATV